MVKQKDSLLIVLWLAKHLLEVQRSKCIVLRFVWLLLGIQYFYRELKKDSHDSLGLRKLVTKN